MLPNVSESWDIGLLGMFIQGPHSPFQTFIHKPKKKHLKGKNEGGGESLWHQACATTYPLL